MAHYLTLEKSGSFLALSTDLSRLLLFLQERLPRQKEPFCGFIFLRIIDARTGIGFRSFALCQSIIVEVDGQTCRLSEIDTIEDRKRKQNGDYYLPPFDRVSLDVEAIRTLLQREEYSPLSSGMLEVSYRGADRFEPYQSLLLDYVYNDEMTQRQSLDLRGGLGPVEETGEKRFILSNWKPPEPEESPRDGIEGRKVVRRRDKRG